MSVLQPLRFPDKFYLEDYCTGTADDTAVCCKRIAATIGLTHRETLKIRVMCYRQCLAEVLKLLGG